MLKISCRCCENGLFQMRENVTSLPLKMHCCWCDQLHVLPCLSIQVCPWGLPWEVSLLMALEAGVLEFVISRVCPGKTETGTGAGPSDVLRLLLLLVTRMNNNGLLFLCYSWMIKSFANIADEALGFLERRACRTDILRYSWRN